MTIVSIFPYYSLQKYDQNKNITIKEIRQYNCNDSKHRHCGLSYEQIKELDDAQKYIPQKETGCLDICTIM